MEPGARRGDILVIDDEETVAVAIERILRAQHDVHIRTDAREALALVAAGSTFDVVFCDLMMPNLSGVDVYRLLAATHPAQAAKIVFITVGAFTAAAEDFLAEIKGVHVSNRSRPRRSARSQRASSSSADWRVSASLFDRGRIRTMKQFSNQPRTTMKVLAALALTVTAGAARADGTPVHNTVDVAIGRSRILWRVHTDVFAAAVEGHPVAVEMHAVRENARVRAGSPRNQPRRRGRWHILRDRRSESQGSCGGPRSSPWLDRPPQASDRR